jgi:DNA-directed RNA polymerase subunit RPC12/RpoP
MTITTRNNKCGFFIGVTCPGCGGKLEIEKNFFVLSCPHCSSRLRITMPDSPPAYLIESKKDRREIRFQVDRFLKEKKQPLTNGDCRPSPVFYPYWKIDAITLKVREREVVHYTNQEDNCRYDCSPEQKSAEIHLSPFTTTLAAFDGPEDIPYSIGMRADYIKLIPFARENVDGQFTVATVTKSWSSALDDLAATINSIGRIDAARSSVNKTEFFRPTGEIVFFPYYLTYSPYRNKSRRFISDGVTGRVLSFRTEGDDVELKGGTAGSVCNFGCLEVEFHRCRNCGFDLPAEPSFVYQCANCGKLTSLEKDPGAQGSILMASAQYGPNDLLFPFWVFKISDVEGREIRSLFSGIYNSNRLIVPAFAVGNFEAMYRLSKRISTAAAKLDIVAVERMDNRFGRVTIGISDALTMAEIIIYRERLQRSNLNRATRCDFRPLEINLMYVPFRLENYFFVDSALGAVTFEKMLVQGKTSTSRWT